MEFDYRLEDIAEAAEKVLEFAGDYKVLAFSGEMGVGKTTLIHALCRKLGVKGSLSSPTYSIINEYEAGERQVYHIDLYRCKNEEEAVRAGVEDCLYSGKTCFVEWPSRAERIFQTLTVRIGINEMEGGTRRISADKVGSTSKRQDHFY